MDNLELTFMGSLSAQWERRGVFADTLFLALGDSRTVTPGLSIGTGDSRPTWQAMVGIGRAFDWGQLTVAWRHLDYDLDANEQISGIEFSGPAIAASFRW